MIPENAAVPYPTTSNLRRNSATRDFAGIDRAVLDLMEAAYAKSTLTVYNWWLDKWQTHAARLGIPAFPADEQQVLRWLHANQSRWGWGSVSGACAALRLGHTTQGIADPLGVKTSSYLNSVRRVHGMRRESEPVAALLPSLVEGIAQALAVSEPNLLRHVWLVLANKGASPAFLANVDFDVIAANRLGWRIGDRRDGITLRRSDPSEHAAGRALDALVERQRLAHAPHLWSTVKRPTARTITATLTALCKRAGVTTVLEALDMDELDWLVKWTEPALATRLRNRALLSIGVAIARRPIELVRINLGDATPLDDGAGWKLVYRRHKSALDGSAPIERNVAHLGNDRSSCGQGCPACTLDSWLALYDRRWHPQADWPLFPSVHGDPNGSARLCPVGINTIVHAIWAKHGDDPAARITGRSMRVGGATGAWRAHIPLQDIADQVTGHKNIDTLQLYLRTIDPSRDAHRLPV